MSTAGSRKPDAAQVREAAQAVAHSLESKPYAVIGGAACALLGGNRVTEDVDFVVPRGETKTARTALRAAEAHFRIDKGTLHTFYKSDPPVEIEILSPPKLFAESFDATTPTVIVDGVKVLKPALILNAKCRSILGRATDDKKDTDADDILFLLRWCAETKNYPAGGDVPNASGEFVQWFISTKGNAEVWTNAGYDLAAGGFP